jgi:hypothetical protein
MKLRSSLLLVLVGVLVSVTPLAYTSPPDPSWIGGIYDDGDFDDVVVFIVSAAALGEPVVSANAGPAPLVIGCAPQAGDMPIPSPAFSSNPVRAPPVS